MSNPWDDLSVVADPDVPNRFRATISDKWTLAVVPQGGIVTAIAVEAMAAALGDPTQTLRTQTSVYAGQVFAGDVDIDVTVLRRGRSMSQLSATVTNPGSPAGLTVVAVFGAPRKGFDFLDLTPPDVPGPDGLRSYRDPIPDGIDFEFAFPRMAFWEEIVETRPATGRAPWEPFEPGPSDVVNWFRFDDPPTDDDGLLHPAAPLVVCDTMPGSVGQKVGPSDPPWFGPSADYTVHSLGRTEPGWLLGHLRARAGADGYASVEMTLWPEDLSHPVAYATQVMFFSFVR
ncbi:MAG: thioesterase family protein [Acidimicrobiales bacterium]|nr:thioesterase family protein [Acidimicrobiales bacterium]